MTKRRRWIIAAICAVLLLCWFVSSALIVREAAFHHHCVGEDCPVCQFIGQVEQVRRAFGALLPALLSVCLVAIARRVWRVRWALSAPAFCTLVGRKIRLND